MSAIQYRTKAQIQSLFACWIIDEEVPHKGREVIVVFPKGLYADEGARISWSPQKNDSGERLYALQFIPQFIVDDKCAECPKRDACRESCYTRKAPHA